jgi:hypothetical protein
VHSPQRYKMNFVGSILQIRRQSETFRVKLRRKAEKSALSLRLVPQGRRGRLRLAMSSQSQVLGGSMNWH